MLTFKRNETSDKRYDSDTMVLDRDNAVSAFDIIEEAKANETEAELKERKSRCLDRLLNYEQYTVEKNNKEEKVSVEDTLDKMISDADGMQLTKDDLLPSSTTMQFENNEEIEDFEKDIDVSSSKSVKPIGKLLIVAYCALVSIIMALIIVNTGIINNLNDSATERRERVNDLQSEYERVMDEVDNVNSEDYIKNVAENEYDMVK